MGTPCTCDATHVTQQQDQDIRSRIESAATSPQLAQIRRRTGEIASQGLREVGRTLHVFGHVVGPGRVAGTSTRGNGDDEVVAVGVLAQVGGELAEAAVPMLAGSQHYAGAALLRQIVEVEYLMWAFATQAGDAKAWLDSTRREREQFFRPARLRDRSAGRFKRSDYAHHCEMGGHPVPRATLLIDGARRDTAQLLLVDLLLHLWRTWDSLVAWSRREESRAELVLGHAEVGAELAEWSRADPLYRLPDAPPLPGLTHP